jgi:hypothetical protein
MINKFFEGKYFSLDLEKAKKLAGDYDEIITGQNWLKRFLAKIDDYCGDHPDMYVRLDDGRVKAPSQIIRTWLEKELDKHQKKPNQQPKVNDLISQIAAEKKEMKEHPERFINKQDIIELNKKLRTLVNEKGTPQAGRPRKKDFDTEAIPF